MVKLPEPTTMEEMTAQFALHRWVKFRPPRSLLPWRWAHRLRLAVETHGTDVVHKGRGPGSLEPEATAGLDYRVLTTDGVREHAPWLWDFYTDPSLRSYVEQVVGRPVETRDGPDALNVNFMRGQKRYEWHTDPDPYTLLLYATKISSYRGGGLMMRFGGPTSRGYTTTLYPKPGEAVLFDGSRVPHAVETLVDLEARRVSAPMVFFPVGHVQAHNATTTAYLYGDSG